MRKLLHSAVALACLSTICSAQTISETFGSGANTFTMDFVTIGNPGNAADTTGNPSPAGAVAFSYNIGKHEVSRDMVLKASTAGGLGLTLADMTFWAGAAANGLRSPASGITWLEAARFVNWMNSSQGYSPAYKFGTDGLFRLWQPSDPGYNIRNLFRNSNSYYFIPTVDEWYKAAFFDPNKNNGSGGYWKYPTGSDTAPVPVENGNLQGTMVYRGQYAPADIDDAGGLSPYGTMAQGGNIGEWVETAGDGIGDVAGENRGIRGGDWGANEGGVMSTSYGSLWPTWDYFNTGFRVASVPEPSSLSLLALGGVVMALGRRRG
jgi:formylglycine-generating enzyme required for sulfatase activity